MSDKVAVVTGASRGIGSAIADRLVADGCFVYATATSEQGAEAISARLGDKGKGVALDIGSDESVAHALEEFAAAEAPTILVNNAGITQDNLMLRMSDEEWSSVINTNLSGVFRLTKGLLRVMSVSIKPGATVLTVMLRDATSRANARANPSTPDLAAT